MAVEIQVLSGARQGERIGIDATEFRVGDCPGAEVVLDPAQDQGAQGRAVRFSLRSDGWYVQNHGVGSILLNEQRLSAARRIRSGDVVRLSERGPDLVFHLVQHAAAAEPTVVENGVAVASVAPVASGTRERGTAGRGMWGRGIAAGLVGALVCLALSWLVAGWLRTPQPATLPPSTLPPVAVPQEPSEALTPPAPVHESQAAEVSAPSAPSKEAATPAAPTASQEPAPAESSRSASQTAWDRVAAAAKPAVLLLCVQETKSGSTWAFATAVAIAEEELLTTATVATELAKFQADAEHWHVWACHDLDSEQLPLKDIRVHAGYVRAGDDPQQRIYFDLARIKVAGKLPAHFPIASPQTLAQLRSGYPVACIGIPHDPDPVDRFQAMAPQVVLGKVFLLTALPPSPGGPRLVHFKASLPPHCYGAPLLSAEGSVLALYAESAPAGAMAGQEVPLHYAVVLEPQLLGLGWEGRGAEVWVAPPRSTPQPPAASAKP